MIVMMKTRTTTELSMWKRALDEFEEVRVEEKALMNLGNNHVNSFDPYADRGYQKVYETT